MISDGEYFNPCDIENARNPLPARVRLTEKSAIEFLQQQGYDISALAKAV
jgi:hypothetical protein